MGSGIGEAILMSAATGAAVGGGTAALTGQDPLEAALLGGLLGGAGAGLGGALGGAPATVGMQGAAQGATQGAAQGALPAITQGANGAMSGASSLLGGQGATQAALQVAPQAAAGATQGLTQGAMGGQTIQDMLSAATPNAATAVPAVPEVGLWDVFNPGENPALSGMGTSERIGNYLVQNPIQVGMGASTIGGLMSGGAEEVLDKEEEEKYKGPLSKFRYDPSSFRPSFAGGGLADTPEAARFEGRQISGPGDGMSDDVAALINGSQPAALADGEFVIPADVVSGLGNGSTDAGARALFDMIDRVRVSRTGRKEQGKTINPDSHLQHA